MLLEQHFLRASASPRSKQCRLFGGNGLRILGHASARKPGFKHGVDLLRRLLLDPMGDSWKYAEGKILYVLLGSSRGANAEGNVGIAPQEERGCLDDGD